MSTKVRQVECETCNGLGWVRDGKTSRKCADCAFTGRRAATTTELLAEFARIREALGTACAPDVPLRSVVDITLGNIRTAWEHDGLVEQIDKLKAELARGRHGDLKPRAIAVLCALRSGPKTANQIGTAIGDGSKPSGRRATDDLLVDMGRIGLHLITQREWRWYLDHDGLGWLQSNGLDAVNEAKIWNVFPSAPGAMP